MTQPRLFLTLIALLTACASDPAVSAIDSGQSADGVSSGDVGLNDTAAIDSGGVDTDADAVAADTMAADTAEAEVGDTTAGDTSGDPSDEVSEEPDADVGAPDAAGDALVATGPPNLLLVVLDDVGLDAVEPWASLIGAAGAVAPIPTLDGLADNGVVFTTAWATPTCSPTRWGLHTGFYPSHGGPLGPVGRGASNVTAGMDTLPRLLGDVYQTGLFGKWHLGGAPESPVTRGGWSHYSGSPSGALPDYFDWTRTVVTSDGEATTSADARYATTAVVDDALEWLGTQSEESPWLVTLAFNAPHTPFHVPPESLRPDFSTDDLDGNDDGECDDDGACYRASIQALDTELGRFLASVGDVGGDRETVVVVIGDNGTPGQVVQSPFDRTHAKDSLFEGGVRVPMWISGPSSLVPGRGVANGLAHAAVDVFATMVELGGVAVPEGVDGVSLVPLLRDPSATVRDTLYTDGQSGQADPVEGAVIRDAQYKVHWFDVSVPGVYGCYDVLDDINEQADLRAGGDAPAVCAELFAALQGVR